MLYTNKDIIKITEKNTNAPSVLLTLYKFGAKVKTLKFINK